MCFSVKSEVKMTYRRTSTRTANAFLFSIRTRRRDTSSRPSLLASSLARVGSSKLPCGRLLIKKGFPNLADRSSVMSEAFHEI